jgi:hypothetical protein
VGGRSRARLLLLRHRQRPQARGSDASGGPGGSTDCRLAPIWTYTGAACVVRSGHGHSGGSHGPHAADVVPHHTDAAVERGAVLPRPSGAPVSPSVRGAGGVSLPRVGIQIIITRAALFAGCAHAPGELAAQGRWRGAVHAAGEPRLPRHGGRRPSRRGAHGRPSAAGRLLTTQQGFQ